MCGTCDCDQGERSPADGHRHAATRTEDLEHRVLEKNQRLAGATGTGCAGTGWCS